jgi:alkylhydroperoxidase/carboxymuconolactone decarboxylase family protein YurZ
MDDVLVASNDVRQVEFHVAASVNNANDEWIVSVIPTMVLYITKAAISIGMTLFAIACLLQLVWQGDIIRPPDSLLLG